MLKEFKEFAMRGNVADLTVGVIIGGAFGKIVDSAVNDLIMPLVGRAIGKIGIDEVSMPLSDTVTEGLAQADAQIVGSGFAYSNFVAMVIDFLILTFVVFLFVRVMNRLMRTKAASPEVPPAPTKEEVLLTEIRDALRSNPTLLRQREMQE